MYSAFIAIHSLLRWVVLLAGLAAVGRGVGGWSGRPWLPADRVTGRIFVGLLDLQFLVGLVLYAVLSPTVSVAFSNVGAAMRDPILRFFLVEHALGMLVAVALAHVGQSKIKKASDDTRRHRTAAVFFGLSLFIMLLSIPWPGMPAGRPLWPW